MLLDVDAAVGRLRALLRPLAEREQASSEQVKLADACGRIVAEAIFAPVDLPPFDASAMDGYAVASAGLDHTADKNWQVIDESLAGHPARKAVSSTSAIRIFTGAVMPDGADAVVLQEDVVRRGDQVASAEPIRPAQHVRHRGHDVRSGGLLCATGRKLSVYDLSWLAACGIDLVRVRRQVRVAVFSTGDELADRGTPLEAGQIYDSNRFAVSTLLREKAATSIDLGCLPDDPSAIRNALLEAARVADLIVTSGGVSVGDADFVKDVVAEIGSIDFWRIALKPGKPLAVGRVGDAVFFGLPGNPVSTIVTYLLFVAPAVDLLAGAVVQSPFVLRAQIGHGVRHAVGRREYMRGLAVATKRGLAVTITGDQGSNRLATFANANCLVVIDENVGSLDAGDDVGVILLSGEAGHPLVQAFGGGS